MNGKQTASLIKQSNELVICQGDWTISGITELSTQIFKHHFSATKQLTIDGSQIKRLDTAGALILQKLVTQLQKKAINIVLINFNREQQALLNLLSTEAGKIIVPPVPRKIYNPFYLLGSYSYLGYLQLMALFAFLGEIAVIFIRNCYQPKRIQWRAFFNVIDQAGFRALPIVALLAFAIGVVLSYQMGQQLKIYGANIYIIGLLGISVLQEFAPLITAIIVAGRTSSAFTAQIGTMKINEEIDALRSMGLSPIEWLVLPKIFGLLVVLPLLILWADIFGLLGGMMMSKITLGLSYHSFIENFPRIIELSTLINGIAKAPVFAIFIAVIGCFQGFQVALNADSVGSQTTKSVVQSIFLIIIADAIFSLLMSWQSLQ